jgi:hypothetical protein
MPDVRKLSVIRLPSSVFRARRCSRVKTLSERRTDVGCRMTDAIHNQQRPSHSAFTEASVSLSTPR